MKDKARQRMMAGIDHFLGEQVCGEAIIVQQRERWAGGVSFVLLLAVVLISRATFDPGGLVRGVIIGVVVGGAFAAFTTSHWLGYCDGTIVLIRLGKLRAKPQELVAEYDYPVAAAVGNGMFAKRVTVAGSSYVIAGQFEQRFRAITGAP